MLLVDEKGYEEYLEEINKLKKEYEKTITSGTDAYNTEVNFLFVRTSSINWNILALFKRRMAWGFKGRDSFKRYPSSSFKNLSSSNFDFSLYLFI